MANSRNLRKGRVSLPNHVYMVTAATHQRRPLFKNLSFGRIVVNAMRYHHQRGDAKTLAYVVMPDHIHWLVQIENCTLASLVKQFKSYSSRRIKIELNAAKNPVWQTGYHDHAVRKEEDLRALARYIIANPIRAGLVSDVREYSLWDAVWLQQ